MKNLNEQKGFTLIELLVVVSIIALLASVVVAGLADARGGAKNNKRNELARQYVTGLSLYHGEYGSYPKASDSTPSLNDDYYCLGDYSPSGTCYIRGSHSQNTNINEQISEFIPGTPGSLENTTATTNEGSYNFFGISYKCTDTNCIGYELSWVVEGSGSDAECFGGATKEPLSSRIAICTYSTNN